jgi:hypothetical protein
MKACSEWAVVTAKAALLSIVPNVSLALAATSDDLFNNYFGNVLAGRPCFARTYDEAHLQAHPAQRVRKVEIDLAKANSDGTPNSADHFAVGFAVMLTSGSQWIGQSANCKTNEADFECYLESDGGLFHLTPQKDGALKFESGEEGLSLDSQDTEIQLSDKNGEEDRAFDLVPSQAECQEASAFFDGGND